MRAPPRFSGSVRLCPVMVAAGSVRAATGCCRMIRLPFLGRVSPDFHSILVARSLSLNRSCSLFFLAAVRLIVPDVLLFQRWILPLCLIA